MKRQRLLSVALSVLFLLGVAAQVAAQSVRVYLVPKTGTGAYTDPFRAKYFYDGTVTPGTHFDTLDYGNEAIFLVVARDISSSDDAIVSAQTDVLSIPANLDNNLSGLAVTTVKTKAEAVNLSADWVTTSLTWRQVLHTFIGEIAIMQRLQGLGFRLFGGAVTLDTTFSALGQNVKNALLSAAASLGYDTSSIKNSTTIRAALKALADQSAPFLIGDVTF
jgi:hypothetical protein